jgi:hypothetical protein
VDDLKPTTSPQPAFRGKTRQVLLWGLLAFLGLGFAWWWASPRPVDEGPFTFQSPFQNTRPGVQYVGDETCAQCHGEIVKTYRQHPMGRSLASLTDAPPLGNLDHSANNPFEAQGYQYLVQRRGRRLFHKEVRRGPGGEILAETEAEVAYVLGSGQRGFSFLINRKGYLFQSPISWYSQKKRWDLAAGYQKVNRHFERVIPEECLFCHCNHAQKVEETLNHYQEPIFGGHAIGCERCHGPGELHAERPGKVGGVDYSIVNPRHLQPALREAVCQQCHLQGEVRVLRAGRKTFDFRPGLPMHLFWSVFVRPREFTDAQKAVGQVEQMYESRCFQKSAGRMGCTSCHDPHQLPPPEEKTSYYRNRCLKCHKDRGCTLSEIDRRRQDAEDSCIRCHMSSMKASDIAHTALTDHRIPRRPRKAGGPADPAPLDPDEIPLVHIHRDLVDRRDKGVSRDLGVALVRLATRMGVSATSQHLGSLALPLFDSEGGLQPGDVAGLHAKGYALWLQSRGEKAQAALEAALATAPAAEMVLENLATLSEQLGQQDKALEYRQRLLEVNPFLSSYHAELAGTYTHMGKWDLADKACQKALELNPANFEARKVWITSLVQRGERRKAITQLKALLAFDPPNKRSLEDWLSALLAGKD